MNFAHVVRLTWKEYRAARAFWVSLVVLVVFVQALILATWSDSAWAISMVYSIALAAPAFFAIGCLGSAFAIEQEEGTYDFLRAAPISSREVLASKLGLAALATLAMFGVLWLLTMALASGRLPEVDQLRRMLGLWLLAAVEAAAWGTLFSLRSARPLAAIVLAMIAATSVVHVLAWSTNVYTPGAIDLESYSAALPWRVLVVFVVLAVDVYLGLRWLDERQSPTSLSRAAKQLVDATAAADNEQESLSAKRLLARDRFGMFGRLAWQQWRQSGWLLLALPVTYVVGALIVRQSFMPIAGAAPMAGILMLVLAPLFGCFVFRADQEQRRYLFFVEHNIPPRYVWLSRQLPWLSMMILSALCASLIWVGPARLASVARVLWTVTNDPWYQRSLLPDHIDMPQVALALAFVAVAYAAGQWASMTIRSGLLSAMAAMVLGGILCCWVMLMYEWQVSWIWSVVPIPLVLLWATWYRAPDWALENTSWPARARAAAAVLLPAAVLLVAVPWYRVHEIPLESPGFAPAVYLSTISREARATGELYLRANEKYVPGNYVSPRTLLTPSTVALTDDDRASIKLNAESLALVLEAAGRKQCAFQDPRTMDDSLWLHNDTNLVELVLASGRQLEQEGQLDEALDRYFDAFKVISQLCDPTVGHGFLWQLQRVERVLTEICQWANQKDQATERVRAAIQRLQAIDSTLLRGDAAIEGRYVLAGRYVRGDVAAQRAFFDDNRNKRSSPAILWPTFMPWETARGERWLDLLTNHELSSLRSMRDTMAKGWGVGYLLPATPYWDNPNTLSGINGWDEPWRPFRAQWLSSITPDLSPLSQLGLYQSRLQVAFEARRRGTLLQLALLAYRIDHDSLPKTLDELVGKYLDRLPNDPYSGGPCEYFPEGLPEPTTPLERTQLEHAQRMAIPLEPGWPCVWCTGPTLSKSEWRAYELSADDDPKRPDRWTYYTLRKSTPDGSQIPMYLARARGFWFPVPSY